MLEPDGAGSLSTRRVSIMNNTMCSSARAILGFQISLYD